MSEYIWSHLVNPFLSATKSSFKLAVRIAKDHDAALFAGKADPDINDNYIAFHPIYLLLLSTYEAWLAQGGTQSGETLSLQLLLKQLSRTKAKQWDTAVQVEFESSTSEYKKLFPNHRTPFQTGSQDDRIAAVSALSTNLIGIVPLAATATDVNNFLILLKDARTLKLAAAKTTGNYSTLCENARIAMCKKMFGNLGRLIGLNEDDPTVIAPLFPIKYIRTVDQIFFTHGIKAGGKHIVVKHKFQPTDMLTITTNTAADVKIFLGQSKDDTGGSLFITVPGNSTVTVSAAQLGDVLNNSYLIVVNLNSTIAADYDIEFL